MQIAGVVFVICTLVLWAARAKQGVSSAIAQFFVCCGVVAAVGTRILAWRSAEATCQAGVPNCAEAYLNFALLMSVVSVVLFSVALSAAWRASWQLFFTTIGVGVVALGFAWGVLGNWISALFRPFLTLLS